MRIAALLLVFIILSSGTAAAAESHLGAALAPVQTAVDAAGSIVTLALPEATRDGTPDAAWALRARLAPFVASLDREWDLPEEATYRAEILAALPYALQASHAVNGVPDDAAVVAVFLARCGGAPLTPDEEASLIEAAMRLRVAATFLEDLAARPPAGVDAAPLARAAQAIAEWLVPRPSAPSCAVLEEIGEEDPFLAFSLFPSTTWPGGEVQLVGLTNAAGTVTLVSDDGRPDIELPVAAGRFERTYAVPADAPLGEVRLTVETGGLALTRILVVDRAPAWLTFHGPATARPGEEVALRVVLDSALPAETDAAEIRIGHQVVRLEGGSTTWTFTAPESGRVALGADYEGSPLMQPASAEFVLGVVALPPATGPPPSTSGAETMGPLPWIDSLPLPWLVWPVLLLLALAMVFGLVRRRTGGTSSRGAVPARKLATLHSAGRVTFVAAFAALVNLLRARGLASVSTTAREAGQRLTSLGVESAHIVERFEAVRYGGTTEEAGWVARMSGWFDDARRSLRGERP